MLPGLQGKLVKHFSWQLVLKARCAELRCLDVPRLELWLRVVGLSDDSIEVPMLVTELHVLQTDNQKFIIHNQYLIKKM